MQKKLKYFPMEANFFPFKVKKLFQKGANAHKPEISIT